MRSQTLSVLSVLGLLASAAAWPLTAVAEEAVVEAPSAVDPVTPEADGAEEAAAVVPIVYVPPSRGGAEGRWGAATRGKLPRIEVLAPLQVGLTAEAQPTLYWYLGSDSDQDITLMLVDARSEETLLEVPFTGPRSAGIHAFALGEHDVTLEPGVAYQWIVAMQPGKQGRSYGATAGGVIERRGPVKAALPADAAARARALAEAGLWYDAFATLRASKDAGTARALERSLLEQVELGEVAQALR